MTCNMTKRVQILLPEESAVQIEYQSKGDGISNQGNCCQTANIEICLYRDVSVIHILISQLILTNWNQHEVMYTVYASHK